MFASEFSAIFPSSFEGSRAACTWRGTVRVRQSSASRDKAEANPGWWMVRAGTGCSSLSSWWLNQPSEKY